MADGQRCEAILDMAKLLSQGRLMVAAGSRLFVPKFGVAAAAFLGGLGDGCPAAGKMRRRWSMDAA